MQNSLITLSHPGIDPAVGLQYATVTGRGDKWFFLSSPAPLGVERAMRADSCLIEPDCGDTVLVCNGGANAVSYILAVLARAERDSASLILPGGVSLNSGHGKLQVNAKQLDLGASESLSLHAPDIGVAALNADMKFQRLNTSAQEVQARMGSVTMMAQALTSTVGRLVQKAKNSFRWTENVDETRAGRMRLQVEERYALKAGHASVIADGQVKIDGEKIDLG